MFENSHFKQMGIESVVAQKSRPVQLKRAQMLTVFKTVRVRFHGRVEPALVVVCRRMASNTLKTTISLRVPDTISTENRMPMTGTKDGVQSLE